MSSTISLPKALKTASAQHFQNARLSFNIPTSLQDVQDNHCVQALTQTTLEFCKETTLHGIKQVVIDIQELNSSNSRYCNNRITWCEHELHISNVQFFNRMHSHKRFRKLLSLTIWTSACIMGAVFAVVLMNLVWKRFQTTPTITTVETNNYPIWNVPFPGVTICNINKVYAPATKNITERLYGNINILSFSWWRWVPFIE